MLPRAVGAERRDGCRTRQGPRIKKVKRNGGAKTRAGGCRVTEENAKKGKMEDVNGKREKREEKGRDENGEVKGDGN